MNRIEKLIKLRNEIYGWAKIELVGQKVLNIDAKMEILINSHGIKHTLKGKSYKNIDMIDKNEAMIMSVKHLKYFLKTSKYTGFEKDKKGRDNILGFHIFTNTFSYKSIEYNVKILVRETTGKTYFYDQALINKKTRPQDTCV
jgi:hypothetical protein